MGSGPGTSITAVVRKASHPVDFVMPPIFAGRAVKDGPHRKMQGYLESWRREAELCFIWVTESGNRDTILDNLWLAGRLMSVSHLALDTVRLMRTLGRIGQGLGTAVGLAKQLNCAAREISRQHVEHLQQTLLRQDATILTAVNRDPADIARTATVTASSEMRHGATHVAGYLPLDIPRGVQLWDWAPHLEQLGSMPDRMEWGSDNTIAKFAPFTESVIDVPPGFDGWATFQFDASVEMIPVDPTSDENRYNLVLEARAGVCTRSRRE